MDMVRLDERDLDWTRVSERLEAGETVQITRDGRVVAKVVPVESEPHAEHPSWKAAGFDWNEVAKFAATLKPSATNSVVEMRKLARC